MRASRQAPDREKPSNGSVERLRQARAMARITQQELADQAGYVKGQVGQWESGVRKPGVDALFHLARVLNVPFAWLAVGEGNPAPQDALSDRRYHSRPLLRASVQVALDFLASSKINLDAVNLPQLVDDLYQRGVQAGLDLEEQTFQECVEGLAGTATIRVQVS